MADREVEVISRKGCSRLFMEFSSSFRGIPSLSLEPMSPASSATTVSESPIRIVKSKGPFSGLVICVTGLSKETRIQVKEATERLGGQYSPHLHPQCTHLVVQSFHGRKFDHALKHGPVTGLFLVTIGWFVDSVKKNVRLNESLYSVNKAGDSKRLEQNNCSENSCIPIGLLNHSARYDVNEVPFLGERQNKRQSVSSSFAGQSFYIDLDIPSELRSKVAKVLYAEGVRLLDRWFIGCDATYVVCEGPSTRKYLGHSSHLVSPMWVLKSMKEKFVQRLVHLSADLVRYIASGEEVVNKANNIENTPPIQETQVNHGERQEKVNLAKEGVRKRRNYRMQSCQTPMRPITPSILLDSICWTISEQTSTASYYYSEHEDQTSTYLDTKDDDVRESESSFANLSRPLTESEKSEIIFKGHILTILFPIDRFSEMGPCSRTFFSNTGFTCLQVLDHIYAFYQESMSSEEIEIAIHTDSRYGDRLRSLYASGGEHVEFKRIDFIGSRRSFEMLKRVSGDNNSNVYELLVRA